MCGAQTRGGKLHLVRGCGKELDCFGVCIAGVDAYATAVDGASHCGGGEGGNSLWGGARSVAGEPTVNVHNLHRIVLPDLDVQDGVEGWVRRRGCNSKER